MLPSFEIMYTTKPGIAECFTLSCSDVTISDNRNGRQHKDFLNLGGSFKFWKLHYVFIVQWKNYFTTEDKENSISHYMIPLKH